MTAAPTLAVFDLLVGEYSLVDGAPPLVGFFLVGEALFEELEEAPLGPFVVPWVGGAYLAGPVDSVTEALSLLAEVGDVFSGDFLGGGVGLDGVVFGGEAESVVAERTENI